jgi:RNA polymerase sigma factor (sigma-70 family)
MRTAGQNTLSSREGKAGVEEILAHYDGYIVTLVRERIAQNPNIANSAVLDLEIDELVQQVRIKFWRALEEKDIQYPKAYVKCVVNSEFIDMTRRRKPVQSLSEDEEGEIYRGNVLVTPGEEMADPAEVVERREETRGRLREVVNAVMELPERQQHVMICSLQDRVDDPRPLENEFTMRKKDIKRWRWPKDKIERQRLQASLSYARHNVAREMNDGAHIQDAYLSPRTRHGHTAQPAMACV